MSEPAPIRRHVLCDGDVAVVILSLGCITQHWVVPLAGRRVPVVLGHDDPRAYRRDASYMGAIVGRVASRISNAGFMLGGRRFALPVNEPPHHLHGGPDGLHRRIWETEPDGHRALRLRLISPDGDQGYPGWAVFTVTITLAGHTLGYDMRAETDRPTPIGLAQHSYYNLMGGGTVFDHRLRIAAGGYTPVRADLIPTGEIAPLEGHPFDLRRARSLAGADPDRAGLDMNYVLDDGQGGAAAYLHALNGLSLTLRTDQPCLQLYTGAGLRPSAGQGHAPFAGLCLEPQSWPDALNNPRFPAIVTTPDRPYRQRLEIRIAPKDI